MQKSDVNKQVGPASCRTNLTHGNFDVYVFLCIFVSEYPPTMMGAVIVSWLSLYLYDNC